MATGRREVLVFEVGGRRFALPAEVVREIVRAVTITPLPQAPALAEGVINLRGRIVPVVDLRRLLGMPEKAVALSDQLIVARWDDALLALRIDQALDLLAVAPDEPVVRLPDGLAPILDLADLLAPEQWAALRGRLRGAADTAAATRAEAGA